MPKTPKIIVITGGPGAGKTAVLELAAKSFCEHVAVLPEAATIVFGGGFWRKPSRPAREAAQKAIFHVQQQLEQLVIGEGKSNVILCDRGTLDGLAYWPGSDASFFKSMETTRKKELAHYSVVIHLRTPAKEQGYNHANPLRTETAQEARQIDNKILKSWKGHPNFHLINGTAFFMEKARRTIEIIRREVPPCACEKTQATD